MCLRAIGTPAVSGGSQTFTFLLVGNTLTEPGKTREATAVPRVIRSSNRLYLLVIASNHHEHEDAASSRMVVIGASRIGYCTNVASTLRYLFEPL